MNKANLKAAEKLAKRYESITLDEIKNAKPDPDLWSMAGPMDVVAAILTGFGRSNICTLCKATGKVQGLYHKESQCSECIHGGENGGNACVLGESKNSYEAIENSQTPEELLVAFKERAKYLRMRIKEETTG